MRYMSAIKDRAKKWRYFTYIFISLWKMLITLIVMMVVWHLKDQSVANLFNNFTEAFSPHTIPVQEASIFQHAIKSVFILIKDLLVLNCFLQFLKILNLNILLAPIF